MPKSDIWFNHVWCALHTPTGGGAGDAPAVGGPGAPPAGDLVTVTHFRLPDPVAAAHGHGVEPLPPTTHPMRAGRGLSGGGPQPRFGPGFLLRFDGGTWRFDRSVVGWNSNDMVLGVWPLADGRAYVMNQYGLWLQWPKDFPQPRLERLVADVSAGDDSVRASAAETLASLGKRALPALRDAAVRAATAEEKQRLDEVAAQADVCARGDPDGVPVVAGRWRFFDTTPQATMSDGRFAFYCKKAVDVREPRQLSDCLAFYDPVRDAFEVRPIDRDQWFTTRYYERARVSPPMKAGDYPTVVDLGGGLWLHGGFWCGAGGRLERPVPVGVDVHPPTFVDPDGRVYFNGKVPRDTPLCAIRLDPRSASPPASAQRGGANATDAGRVERHFPHVTGVFRQPDVAPPWNAWAVQRRDGKPDAHVLLRLDGPDPTRVDLPPGLETVNAVVPLDGGCIASRPGVAGFWDGRGWDVAADVKKLVERHGARFTRMVPTRVFSADTSAFLFNHLYEHQLMLASDGRGGLWLAEDSDRRHLWHWDGKEFTDVWKLLPLEYQRREDGAVITAEGGRVLVVQIEPNLNARPGGYWAVWYSTAEDLRRPNAAPQGETKPG